MSESNIFTIYGTDPFLIELKRDEVFLELKKNNLIKLDSDTDNIIEYIDEKENKEKKLSFWDLIKNED